MTSAQAGTVAAAAGMHSGEDGSMNPRCISIITKSIFLHSFPPAPADASDYRMVYHYIIRGVFRRRGKFIVAFGG